ncbi:hypothetical protein DEU56DRAFT_915646 [Suillus clintonianus]|uniref:uncharacterized protein n=1 Tax=Suillus clintonianus TaxID=1904413 RepID=UPI001B867D0E|nr:uncharacterized protein DEU56DRAFT_915646 [Suillus clintonianus]KAG2127674.1 hypothetical protein DEU56DRAFT_915646 [Suillus clintonianus]
MGFPTDGLYMIRNTGRNLMLDLYNNNAVEGNPINGWTDNGNLQAQRWIVRNQNHPGSQHKTISIQSNNAGNHGNGFFTAKQDSGERVRYTRIACLVDLVGRTNNTFTMSFTRGNADLVLAIPSGSEYDVKLENYHAGSARQQWEFTKV